MDMKRLIVGSIVGAITIYILGYLIFEMAAADFYAANRGPTDIARDVNLEWAVALGGLALAALFTIGIIGRPGVPTIRDGAIIGGVYGFLVWFGVDFILYGITERNNLTLVIVDPILELIRSGITGAVIAGVLAKLPKTAEAQPSA